MKSILLSLTLALGLLLNSNYSNSQIIISSNTTWSGTQFLSSSVVIQPGAKLTIQPGTLVYFGYVDANGDNIGDVQIEVNGKLVIKGNAACSPVVFRPYTVTTNKKYWKGIKINSNVNNDSLFGAHIYNAETPFNVLSQATIRDCKIRQFDNTGINFVPTNSSVNLLVQSTSIKSGKTAIFQSSATSALNADWVIIDSCTNGVIGNTGSIFLESSLVQNSTRLGVSFKDGTMNISNSRIKKNYVFGVFNVSGDLNVSHCDIDSNSLGGVLMAGVGVNNLQNSNIRYNTGSQIEITDYGFNITNDEFYNSYWDGVPTITVNNNNILGDTLSSILDEFGLFDMPSGAGGSCWASNFIGGSCVGFTNNCITGGWSGNSSPTFFHTPLGRLSRFWVSFAGITTVNLRLRDENQSSDIGSISWAGCLNNPSQGGIFDVIPTYVANKYININSVGGQQNFLVNANSNKAYYKFGGDLIFNDLRYATTPFNFQNNNFGQPSLSNYFFDQTGQNINYAGFTIFPITNAGLAFGSSLISVSPFPIAYLQTSNNSNVSCSGGSFFLIAPSLPNATYNWYLNGNLFAVNSSNQYSPIVGGQWHCVASTGSCSIKTTVRNITLSQGPNLVISGNTTICQGQTTELNVTGGSTYLWSNGATLTSQSFSPSSTSSYTVTGTSNGCSTTQAFQINVNPLPNASISPYPSAIACVGSSVQLSASQANSYLWNNGATTQAISVTNPGVYNVTITDANGCSATSNNTTVINLPGQSATITNTGSTNLCAGGSVLLNANTGTGLTYQWNLNGSNIAGATTSSYTANASGSYTVVVTNSSTCSSTSTATVVTVNALPIATISPATATNFCQGGSVVLNANTGTGLTYQWRLNGNPISGATSSSYTANASGSYTVVVTNSSTCSSTSTAVAVTVNALPTATITPATAMTFCQGGSVVLNANTGTGLTYQWRLNGNPISGATSSSYTANASGSYTVVVTNASTCSSTSTAVVVTVNALPTATIIPATATTFCQGGSVVLNANTGTGLTYQWRLNGNPISGATSSSYTANASGSYTVTVTNASTCSSTSTAVVVTVNALPTATITPATATTFCQGGSVVLNANTGIGLTYQWFNNATAISGATSASYTATINGSYTMTVTNASSCSSTSIATVVTVDALPTATITPATATTFCQGGSVILNANAGTGLTYQWFNNATAISGATSSSYTANVNGSYTVVVSNASTCSSTSAAIVVTVNALPSATITPASVTTFCQGGSVVLDADTGIGFMYQWKLNGVNISGANSSSFNATQSGNYTVTIANTNGCSATSNSTTVTVNGLPTASITPATTTTFCQGGSVVLNANTGTGLSYQWFNNATSINGATGSSYTASASGSYTVTVTNSNGCSATSSGTSVLINTNTTYFADTDNDGFGNLLNSTSTCIQPAGYVVNSLDCNDSNGQINPSANEVCNSFDDDCNSQTDEGLTFTTYYSDSDNDGFGSGAGTSICSNPGVGYSTNALDCNNANSAINPSANELCNSSDDNCNNQIDDGLLFQNYYQDFDGDGFGFGTPSSLCASQTGYVNNAFDCNDFQAQVNPIVQEICNGIDDNCNTLIDDGLQFTNYFLDGDQDGFGAGSPQSLCSNPGNGYSTLNTDCNDAVAAINPSETEICNSLDDNCNLQIDEGLVFTNYFADNDSDGFGNPAQATSSCSPINGMVTNNGDCNDTNPNINPLAEDIGGNGIDENCDGEIDNIILELSASINLYPNPTRSELNIQISNALVGNDMYIFDAVGKLVYKEQLLSTQTTLSMSEYADGNYIFRVGEVVKRFEVMK